MIKGVPLRRRNSAWHKKHLKRLRRRQNVAKGHNTLLRTRKSAKSPKVPVYQKESLWARFKRYMRFYWAVLLSILFKRHKL